MCSLQRLLASLRIAAVVLTAWLTSAAIAVAETRPGAENADTGKSYVVPYALVVLAIALGLMIVCRSANRSTDLKQSDDD